MNAKPDAEVAQLIELSNMCATFNCLPNGGGLLDQEYRTIRNLYLVRAAQAERAKLEQERAAKKQK